MDLKVLAIAKKYTDDTMKGTGAIQGKNCTITKIENDDANKVSLVTFSWTENDGTVKTEVMSVPYGLDGKDGVDGKDGTNGKDGEKGKDGADGETGKDGLSIKGAEINDKKHLILTLSDDSTLDAGLIPEQTVDLSDYVKKDGTKVLSTNDYDNTEKEEVAKVKDKAEKSDIENIYNDGFANKNLIYPSENSFVPTSAWVSLENTYAADVSDGTLVHLKAGTYTINLVENTNVAAYQLAYDTEVISATGSKTFSLDTDTDCKVRLKVTTVGSPALFKMQIEKGSVATSYVKYAKSNVELTDDITEVNEKIDAEIARKELEIAELKMLGWNTPKECPIQNEVNGNQFIQRVGRVELGALDWGINAYAAPTAFSLHENIDLPDLVSISDNKEDTIRCYSPNYDCDSAGKVTGTTRTYTFCVITGKRLYVRADLSTAEELKAELKDKYIYYELATPIVKQIDGGEIIENFADQGLINKAVWNQGSINYSSGAIVASTTAIYSDEIPCKQGDLISVANMENSGENIVIVYYNASGYVGKDVGKLQFTVPANVTKFRANYRKASTPNSNAKVFVNNAISKIGFTRTVIKDYEITVSANSVGQITLDSSQANNLFAVANIPYNGTDGFANVEPAVVYVKNITSQERLFKVRVMAFF